MADQGARDAPGEFWTGVVQKVVLLEQVALEVPAHQVEAAESRHHHFRELAASIVREPSFWMGVARRRRVLGALPGARRPLPVAAQPEVRTAALVPAGRSPLDESSGSVPAEPPAARAATGGDMSTAETALVAALYDEYGPALYRVAYRFLQDRGRAEDAVQEVLLRAWRHPERLDPATGSLRAWLFTVARNVLTDQWRADQARPRTVADETAVEAVAAVDVFDRLVEGWQVEEALGDLSLDQRRVLVEVYYRGRSVAEAARELGIPAGTVKSRTHYALRTLRAALERRGLAP